MTQVAILVPLRAGIPERDRLWQFVRSRCANQFPEWPIVEGHHDVGPFNRSAAVNLAAELAGDWDVALIVDADTVADPDTVRAAVDVAHATGALVMAGDERVMLTKEGTKRVLTGYRGNWRAKGMEARTYHGESSGALAVSRALWEQVGGFDPLFVGWGHEDLAFRAACETVAGRPMIRLSAPLFHLWHPTSPEDNPRLPNYASNRGRWERYQAAAGDAAALRVLLDEAAAGVAEPVELGPSRIPRVLHRTVPAETSEQVEQWWAHFEQLHPGWECRTWREPLDPKAWPLTGGLWNRCANGAQKAGLIRLEALVTYGGVYVDSDVEPVASFEPLVHAPAFAGWEDEKTVPDAVLGAEPQHPAFVLALEKARRVIEGGGDAWHSGPGVTTEVLPNRPDVLLLPPGSFYAVHYLNKRRLRDPHPPYAFARHHWAGSWLTPAQKRSQQQRQK